MNHLLITNKQTFKKPENSKFLFKQPIQVITNLPCPMKVPFRQLFNRFTETYNVEHPQRQVYCPEQNECDHPEVDIPILETQNEDELPDIFLTSGFNILFDKTFHEKFVKTGIWSGYIDESQWEYLPKTVLNISKWEETGFLRFSETIKCLFDVKKYIRKPLIPFSGFTSIRI
ncbi:MAG: hypothetical protein PHH37_15055 [Paludibacter sp.]|nr:hypothetical protein [Paludibacter sp.]